MAEFSLTNPTIHVHDFDFTTALHKITFHMTAAELENTTFGSTYRSRIGGLKTVDTVGDGYLDYPAPDSALFADLGVMDRVMTASAEGLETKVAYMLQVGRFDYEFLGQIGQVGPFVMTSKNSNAAGVVRGQYAKAKGSVSATGPLGSGLNLGAVTSGKFLYATFHIFTVGTTVTVQVQSDTANNFPAPTVRATIGPLTTTGGTWMTKVAGPITDTWWRFNVSAITGTFVVAGAIGIQ